MNDLSWTCPHCREHSFVPTATDDRIIVCESCEFIFAKQEPQTDESTWRQQAQLFDHDGKSFPYVRSDRYRVIRSVASGAQGRILLAHHCHLDQICVLKILEVEKEWKELATARLQAEARAGAMVNHHNVARVLDCDSVEGTWYFAMEYVPGENLRKIIHATGKMCWPQVVELATQIADGLAAIHAVGLIHRDIKPSNIMLRSDGVPKIMDLGLVKMDSRPGDMTLTHDGQVLGTPYYMPPEQFEGNKEVTPRADIYSLGATMFHLLSGRPPHKGAGVVELANRHKHDPVIWPDEVSRTVPSWLRHVVEVCLAKRPDHRFASAEALCDALRSGVDVTNLLPYRDDQNPPQGIVVMALHNLSRHSEDEWIGEAVAEYISSRLMEVEGLHIVDRHSLQKVLTQQADGRAITNDEEEIAATARMLGARILIVGSFQRSSDQIRITLRSVNQEQHPQNRITANVSGSVEELFTLEDQLAGAIIDAIGHDQSTIKSDRGRGTRNLEAHEKFIRGRRAFSDGDYQQAIKLASQALEHDPEYLTAISLIGASFARVGDYDRAQEYHEREEIVARRNNDDRGLAEALGNLGVMYYFKGEYSLAYDFLEQARDLCSQLGQFPDTAKYEGNLGFVLMRLERNKEAETAFSHAIEIHKKYGDLVSLAWPYNGMGGVLLAQQRYAEASEYYRRALGLANEIGDRVNIGVSHMNLGRCACLLNDYAEAEACFDEALEALNGTDFWNGLTLVYEHMADMYLQEGNTDSAIDCINKRLELAQKHNNERMEAEAWEQKAKAYELAGDKEMALGALKQSLEVSQKPAPHESLHRHLAQIAKKHPSSS